MSVSEFTPPDTSRKPRRQCLLIGFLVLGMLTLSNTPGFAWKKAGDKNTDPKARIENYEPPDVNMLKDTCEPIRAKIVALNLNTPKYAHIFIVPRREYLENKLQRCKAKFMSQEYTYLKHVDVRKPELEKLPAADETTSEPVESKAPDTKPDASPATPSDKTP